jgi:hypothetical protein
VDSFTYTVDDGRGAGAPVTVEITVNHVDHLPEASPFSIVIKQDESFSSAIGYLNSWVIDPDGDALTYSLAKQAGHGVAAISPDGAVTYTPNPGFTGPDSFSYRAFDGVEYSFPAKVSVTVLTKPAGGADTYSVTENRSLKIDAAHGVLANDTDPEGDSLTAKLKNDVQSGQLSFNADGSFTYQPNAGFQGWDSFTYYPQDGSTSGDAVLVQIAVVAAGVNLAPTVADLSYDMTQDSVLTVSVAQGIVPKASDPENDPIYVEGVGQSTIHGMTYLYKDGSFVYTPVKGFTGDDYFEFRVYDSDWNESSVHTVAIHVAAAQGAGTPDPSPTATPTEEPATTPESTPVATETPESSPAVEVSDDEDETASPTPSSEREIADDGDDITTEQTDILQLPNTGTAPDRHGARDLFWLLLATIGLGAAGCATLKRNARRY